MASGISGRCRSRSSSICVGRWWCIGCPPDELLITCVSDRDRRDCSLQLRPGCLRRGLVWTLYSATPCRMDAVGVGCGRGLYAAPACAAPAAAGAGLNAGRRRSAGGVSGDDSARHTRLRSQHDRSRDDRLHAARRAHCTISHRGSGPSRGAAAGGVDEARHSGVGAPALGWQIQLCHLCVFTSHNQQATRRAMAHRRASARKCCQRSHWPTLLPRANHQLSARTDQL